MAGRARQNGEGTGTSVIFRWEGVRKNCACLDAFYDRIFSRAYSAVLEIVGLFLSLN